MATAQINPVTLSNQNLAGATALPRVISCNVPVFILLVSACVLVLFVYLLYYKKTFQLIKGVFSYGSSRQLQREGYSFFKFFSLSLTTVYIICAAVFFCYLNERGGWITLSNSRWILPFSVFFLAAVLLIKKFSSSVLSLFLKNQKALNDYFFQYSFSVKTEGLFLLPLCLLLYYSAIPPICLIIVGLVIPVLVFLLRIARALLWGGAEYGFSVFHIVLYLCTVEIIPLAVFIKVLAAGWLRFG
ncbi:MAG TPA: DUF4271 domain-containing protein [Bacteroidia bacterium]|jgi:hypothetical protein|nr:DUF4271 domain-containing protein [Bacteroidia bacterium]